MVIIGTVLPADIDRISGKLFMTEGDKSRNLSAFWVLLTLAAVIATAGVIADSTATVIGAMIVAPLMTPILGTALSIVLARRKAMWRSISLVVGGALTVVAVGFLLGLLIPIDVTSATNSQVAGRVSPGLVDLVAALATGLVGAFALLRSEVSDTLPGVAIAISLVPPLAVVGLTAESGAYSESLGALVLFTTNVAAIIATGTLLMLLAGVRDIARSSGTEVGELKGRTLAGVCALLAVVSVPLALSSVNVIVQHVLVSQVQTVATAWADEQGWIINDVRVNDTVGGSSVAVRAIGRPPEANREELRAMLDDAGFEDIDVQVTLLFGGQETLESTSNAASED
ncbi:MAG: DUF389 domain-containing protein [Ornithinimicrobium sp.]